MAFVGPPDAERTGTRARETRSEDLLKRRITGTQLILRLYELDPGVRRAFFQNFITNASLKGSATQEEMAKKYNCNIPWAILLDPTTACNLNCTGCWAAEYGHQYNLSLEDIDSIVRQGQETGHLYVYLYRRGAHGTQERYL